jgi:hypothetical protein
MTPAQCRAARGLLNWKRSEVAASGVDERTVRRFENEEVTPHPASLEVIRQAFETAGIIFLEESAEGGAGVRLKT